MLSELITLPVRVGVRATRLWLHASEETLAVAAKAGGRLIDAVISSASSSGPDHPSFGGWEPQPARPPAATPAPPPPAPPRGPRPAAPPEPRASEATPAPANGAARAGEPRRVSEAPELVEEFAEPGAEEGAGAEVHVEEPWKGYGQLTVKDVIARLAVASPAELAAVQLYERGHRGRRTILTAAERALASANGSGAGN